MSEHSIELQKLAEEFESCQKILLALGDENRQHLILEMIRMGECDGAWVGVIIEKRIYPAPRYHITCES